MKIFRYVFYPISILIAGILTIRHLLFSLGWRKTYTPQIPSIGIGNLSLGGTGKTPLTIFLARHFSRSAPWVVSRGYGRKSKGYLDVIPNGSAQQFGDEPLEIATKTQARVSVCEQRTIAVKKIEASSDTPQLILFDDIWQHRWITPKVHVLLTPFSAPFVWDQLFPVGHLRDLKKRARHAHAVLVTKTPHTATPEHKEKIRRAIHRKTSCPVFFTGLQHRFEAPTRTFIPKPDTSVKHLVFTGIAQPLPLHHFLKNESFRFETLKYVDHHNFREKDLQEIGDKFTKFATTGSVIFTTWKDWLRLEKDQKNQLQKQATIVLIHIELTFESLELEQEFIDLLTVELKK